ncbi:MAG: MgtC/SapB family protein [Phycisphaerales bacterium JB040]
MDLELVGQLGIALGLGLLVGLEREWSEAKVAGIRTFALIALLGALCGSVAAGPGGAWTIGAGLLAVAGMFWMGNRIHTERGGGGAGMTTEIAGLVMFMVGAGVTLGHAPVGVVTTGVVAVLLHWKRPLHVFVQRMGQSDVRAVLRLVIIGMVILPVLPNESYGPYGVLNPREIWLMVVLIVGISMAAYVAQRLLSARTGTVLAGVLGGLISSTATTVSFARRAGSAGADATNSSIVIMIASTVVFARVLVEIALVAPTRLAGVAGPLGAMMAFMAAVCAAAFLVSRPEATRERSVTPPSDLKAAVVFGLLYAAVLFGVAVVRDHYGELGMYAVAALSGLTDMDAITLSSAQLMNSGNLDVSTGWRLILVGGLANLLFKLGAVGVLGGRRLLRRVLVMFGVSLLFGAGLLTLWA